METLPIILPALLAFNIILGGVGKLLGALHQSNAESLIGKIAGLLQKAIDLIQGNMAHK